MSGATGGVEKPLHGTAASAGGASEGDDGVAYGHGSEADNIQDVPNDDLDKVLKLDADAVKAIRDASNAMQAQREREHKTPLEFLAQVAAAAAAEDLVTTLMRAESAMMLPRWCLGLGNGHFRQNEYDAARASYEAALLVLVCLSRVLRKSTCTYVDTSDGIRVFEFSAHRCEDQSDEGELQILHQAAVVVRNAGITLCQMEKWAKAEQYLLEASMFRSTGMEVKTYFWKSMAQLRLQKYSCAVSSVDQAESIGAFGRRQMLSKRLHRRNAKMLRDPVFGVQAAQCRVLFGEQVTGMYQFQNMLREQEPGKNHLEYNLDGVTRSHVRPETSEPSEEIALDAIKAAAKIEATAAAAAAAAAEIEAANGTETETVTETETETEDVRHVDGLVAAREYREGDIVFVAKALACGLETETDRAFVRFGSETSISTMYTQLHDLMMDRKSAAKQQHLLRRFCQFLMGNSGNDPTEYDMMRDTCVQIAEGMGALQANGEIDHSKVARELMKQEALCAELFGEYFQDSQDQVRQILDDVGFLAKGKGAIDDSRRVSGNGSGNGSGTLSAPAATGASSSTKSPATGPSNAKPLALENTRCEKLLQEFCSENGLGSRRDLTTASSAQIDTFVRFSMEHPEVDPFATALVARADNDAVLRERVLGLPATHKGCEPASDCSSGEARIRRVSLLHRVTSYDFKNGADMLLSKSQCPVEVSTRRTCLWEQPTLLGHSCVPNTRRLHFGHLCFVQAARYIPKGAPLTACYTPSMYFGPSGELAQKYGFRCCCEYCKCGGREAPRDVEVRKWKEVFFEKVLPKFSPDLSFAVAQKHADYAVKLLAKLESLVVKWTESLAGSISHETGKLLMRVHFLEVYYALINALERRPESELRVVALTLRERRIRKDCLEQLGLLTLICKHYITVENDPEKAQLLLPLETEAIRQLCFAHDRMNSKLISFIMRTLLYIVDFPSSDIVPPGLFASGN